MRAANLLFSCLLLSNLIRAQEIDDMLVYETREIDKFLNSTTYIVLDQYTESDYSKAIREVAGKYWKITKFEVIDLSKYHEYFSDKTKSFLTREYIVGTKDVISLNLFMGGQRSMENKGRILVSTKLKHYTATDIDFLYKLPTILQSIQWKVQLFKDKQIGSEEQFQKYLESRSDVKKTKTLYILKEYLTDKIESMDRVQKYYKYDVSLVDREQIKMAIDQQDTSVIYLSIVAPTKNWKGQPGFYRIYTANGGETLVSYMRAVSSSAPVGVTGYDLSRFNK